MTDEISDRDLQSYISGRLPEDIRAEIDSRLEADAELRARLHNLRLQTRLLDRVFGDRRRPED